MDFNYEVVSHFATSQTKNSKSATEMAKHSLRSPPNSTETASSNAGSSESPDDASSIDIMSPFSSPSKTASILPKLKENSLAMQCKAESKRKQLLPHRAISKNDPSTFKVGCPSTALTAATIVNGGKLTFGPAGLEDSIMEKDLADSKLLLQLINNQRNTKNSSPTAPVVREEKKAKRTTKTTPVAQLTFSGDASLRNPALAAVLKKHRSDNPLSLAGLEGVKQLTIDEYEFCSYIRLKPDQFLDGREKLVDYGRKHGFFKKSRAQTLMSIDVNKIGKLYEFLMALDLLPSKAT